MKSDISSNTSFMKRFSKHYQLCLLPSSYPQHGPRTYVRRPWLMEFIKLGYSLIDHAWLLFCVAIWMGIVKNLDAPPTHRKEGRQLVITWLYAMCLLTRTHNMINHGLRAWVWQCFTTSVHWIGFFFLICSWCFTSFWHVRSYKGHTGSSPYVYKIPRVY